MLVAISRETKGACQVFDGEVGGQPFVLAVVTGAAVADFTKLIDGHFVGPMVEYAEHEQTVEMPEPL